MNRRGQIFALWWVILTLVLCCFSVLVFLSQQDTLTVAVVSPTSVLDIRDSLELFERAEAEIITQSYNAAGSKYDEGSDDFMKEFRKVLLDEAYKSSIIKSFLTSDISFNGRMLDENIDWKAFFSDVLYPEESFRFTERGLEFSRVKITKHYYLRASQRNKINFDMALSYEFGRDFYVARHDKILVVSSDQDLIY